VDNTHIYEYLFAAVIAIAILVASSVIVTTMPSAQLSASDKEQVKIAAEKVMTQVLLNSGQPPNWGSDTSISESNLQDFGLAKYHESTREAYVLDPDNVQRLDSGNPLYISPSVVAHLLNLDATAPQLNLANSYGFTLDIHPLLKVQISPLPSDPDSYNVTVSSEYQALPVVNAQVTAMLYYPEGATINYQTASGTTHFNGSCSLTFSSVPDPGMKILVVSAEYMGIHTTQVYASQSAAKAHLFGDKLLVDSLSIISTTKFTEVIATKQAGQYVISNFNVQGSTGLDAPTGFRAYTLSSAEPSVVAVLFLSDDQTLYYASKNIDATFSTIPNLPSSSSLLSYSLERTAIIGDTTCTVRLQLWRMTY